MFDIARRMTRRPQNPFGSVAYGLGVFAVVVGVLAALAYGLGLALEGHSNLGHNRSVLVVFLLLGSVACIVGVGAHNLLFGVAVGASILALGFGLWGRGSPRSTDPYIENLESLVGPDWGRPSATCKRSLGPRSGLSLCTVQGVDTTDRFQVCVTWVRTLIYRPVRQCGLDAPGLTDPPLHSHSYRASAIAACLRDLPPAPGAGQVPVIDVIDVRPIHRYGQSGTELVVQYGESIANVYFLKDEAGAERWYRYLHRILPIPKSQEGKGLYRRRNAVVVWGDPALDFASQLDVCLTA